MNTRIFIGQVSDFPQGKAKLIQQDGMSLVVNRMNDTFCAIENRCPHLGLPLHNGKVEENTITCPFHGSKFDMCTGENLDWVTSMAGAKVPQWTRKMLAMGRKPSPVKSFSVIQEDENLYIEI